MLTCACVSVENISVFHVGCGRSGVSKYVNWCFTPSQSVWLYQGEGEAEFPVKVHLS